MIDLNRAKKAFKEYCSQYNPEDKKIKLKIAHMERTAQVAKNIAQSLNLEQEDIELAELIGLLHDIGRFEQIKQYNTFVDKDSINHGEYGAKVLFEQGKIRDFIEEEKYDEIIKKAIQNHNRGASQIENELTPKELLHTRIIRDADKTDIFYVLMIDDIETCYGKEDFSKEKITDEVYSEFMEEQTINYQKMKNATDTLVAHFAYVFDFNFKYGLQYIKENNYLDKLYKRFNFSNEETEQRIQNVYYMSKKYIEKRLEEE